MRLSALFVLLALLSAVPAAAQSDDLPFTVELVEVDVTDMPALHSFAWAEHDGRWLFLAGRLDGLHGIIESGAFAAEQANDAVWVVDRATDRVWSRSLDELDAALADPLRTTNTQYHQDGETLYIVGGYGTDSAAGQKITFPTLTAVDVPGLIEAVTEGGLLAPHLRQIEDERLAVTGGELREMGGEYLLFGGHRFDGEYSPGNGSSFTQAYTEEIFSFYIENSQERLAIESAFTLDYEPELLHRRDLTVAPSVVRVGDLLGGASRLTEGFGLYGGVFQPDANLPQRETIFFGYSDAPEIFRTGFEQRFAHYTAPTLPLFDAEAETMHTTFFGGMAQFYLDETTGDVVEDFLVPFTDDIVTLTHDVSEDGGATYETVRPVQMPGLLGTNAVLIPADLPRSPFGIADLNQLEGRTLAGWITGGIHSTGLNPGWSGMTAAETRASERVFEVWVTPLTTDAEPEGAPARLALDAPYPNPFRSEATVALVLDRAAAVAVEVFDVLGRRVATLHDGPLAAARHTFTLRGDALPPGVYVVRAHGDGISATRSLVHID